MREVDEQAQTTKDCARCGGRAFYWRTAVIPGDPAAPRRSSRALPRHQPAWTCMNCGYIEPHDRRTPRHAPADRFVSRVTERDEA